MSTIIAFLERAGRECGDSAVAAEGMAALPADARHVLQAGEPAALAAAFGLRPVLSCMVSAPDFEPEPENVPDDVPEEPDGESTEAA
jgi:hypothetical protein